jgi:hypothetical protein
MDRFNFVMPLDQLKTDSRHNHLDIFREFLDHPAASPTTEATKLRVVNGPLPSTVSVKQNTFAP